MGPDVLQEVNLPLISSADCKLRDPAVTDRIICAGGTSGPPIPVPDTCQVGLDKEIRYNLYAMGKKKRSIRIFIYIYI